MNYLKKLLQLVVVMGIALLVLTQPSFACGGLFCQNIPVDQSAERIIFTVDPDVVTAYVQINYTGSAPDFAWVVPVPSVPEVDVVEIDMFDELQTATDPVFRLPPVPDCMIVETVEVVKEVAEAPAAEADVTVFSSGEVGPYGFDVVGTETGNSRALIDWLNENKYRITPEMEPLVFMYVEEQMVFLAMKLQPDQGTQDIQPVKMTYTSQRPMIPIRLTAVAANPDMGIYTWIYGRARAESLNFASLNITEDDIELINFFGGTTNYRQLIRDGIDRFGGQAFITEYAQPTTQMRVVDPVLQALRQKYPYVTRLYGQMSPEEMTVDPVFDFNTALADISNIWDLTDRTDLYPCQDDNSNAQNISTTSQQNANSDDVVPTDQSEDSALSYMVYGAVGTVVLLLLGAILGGGVVFWLKKKM